MEQNSSFQRSESPGRSILDFGQKRKLQRNSQETDEILAAKLMKNDFNEPRHFTQNNIKSKLLELEYTNKKRNALRSLNAIALHKINVFEKYKVKNNNKETDNLLLQYKTVSNEVNRIRNEFIKLKIEKMEENSNEKLRKLILQIAINLTKFNQIERKYIQVQPKENRKFKKPKSLLQFVLEKGQDALNEVLKENNKLQTIEAAEQFTNIFCSEEACYNDDHGDNDEVYVDNIDHNDDDNDDDDDYDDDDDDNDDDDVDGRW